MVAIYLGRQLGGHRHEEIGNTVGLAKTSSVSSAYLLMKERVAKEKPLQQRVRKIEEPLTKLVCKNVKIQDATLNLCAI